MKNYIEIKLRIFYATNQREGIELTYQKRNFAKVISPYSFSHKMNAQQFNAFERLQYTF